MSGKSMKVGITVRGILTEIICGLFVLLFLYTALSKVLDVGKFRGEMFNQPFPHWIAGILIWLVPATELLTVVAYIIGLFVGKVRTIALRVSLVVMSLFSLYTFAVLIGAFHRVPCSCGGIVGWLSWKQHLVLNLFFVGIAVVALMWQQKSNISPLPIDEINIETAGI